MLAILAHSHVSRSRSSHLPSRSHLSRNGGPSSRNFPPGFFMGRIRNSHRNSARSDPDFSRNPERNLEGGENLKNVFQLFLTQYLFMGGTLTAFFFAFVLFAFILKIRIEYIAIVFQVILGGYIIYLLRQLVRAARMKKSKAKIAHRIFKSIVFIIFLLLIQDDNMRQNNTFIFAIVLSLIIIINYFISVITRYISMNFRKNKLARFVHKFIFSLRFLISLQLIFLLIQEITEENILWPIVFIPGWIAILLLFALTIKSIHVFFLKFRRLFWNPISKPKIKGVIWVFANLISMIGALTSLLVFWCMIPNLHRWVNDSSFGGVFIAALTACVLLTVYTHCFRNDIFEAFTQLSRIINGNRLEMYRAQAQQNGSPTQKKEKELKLNNQFVAKISSSYYKILTPEELQQLNSKNIFLRAYLKMKRNTDKNNKKDQKNVDEEKANDEKNKCIICFNNVPDAVIMDCGHSGICFKCGQEMIKTKQECHMCRSHVKALLHIDIAHPKSGIFKVISNIETSNLKPAVQ